MIFSNIEVYFLSLLTQFPFSYAKEIKYNKYFQINIHFSFNLQIAENVKLRKLRAN